MPVSCIHKHTDQITGYINANQITAKCEKTFLANLLTFEEQQCAIVKHQTGHYVQGPRDSICD